MGRTVTCDGCGKGIEIPSDIHITPPIVCFDCGRKAPRILSLIDAEAAEDACAADLWRRLITIWESAEEDELHDKLGALVDEWQGFVGKKEPG